MRREFTSRLHRFVYAQHGRELMGLKSPVCEPLYVHLSVGKILDEGNCGRVTDRGEEAGDQNCEPTDRNNI
jgi:hypothetical protein